MGRLATVKVPPETFRAIRDYRQNFLLIRDEDGFVEGDTVRLAEWDGENFTGRVATRLITFVMRHCPERGLMPGYCIIGIQNETEFFIKRRQRMMFTLPKEEGD